MVYFYNSLRFWDFGMVDFLVVIVDFVFCYEIVVLVCFGILLFVIWCGRVCRSLLKVWGFLVW